MLKLAIYWILLFAFSVPSLAYPLPEGESPRVSSAFQAKDGRIYARLDSVEGASIGVWDNGTWRKLQNCPKDPHWLIGGAFPRVITASGRIFRLENDTLIEAGMLPSNPSEEASFLATNDGALWFSDGITGKGSRPQVWRLTPNAQAFVFDESAFVFEESNPLAGDYEKQYSTVKAVEGRDGSVFFYSPSSVNERKFRLNSIFRYRNEKLEKQRFEALPEKPIRYLFPKDAETFLAFLDYEGIYEINWGSGQVRKLPEDGIHFVSNVYSEGDRMYVVAGRYSFGPCWHNGAPSEALTVDYSLPTILWELNGDRAVQIIDGVDRFVSYGNDNIMHSLITRRDGKWIGSNGNGLWHIAPDGKVQQYSWLTGYPFTRVDFVFASNDGKLVVSDRESGTHELSSEGLSAQRFETTQLVNVFRSSGEFARDQDGNIWTIKYPNYAALSKWDGNGWSEYPLPAGTGHPSNYSVVSGYDQRIWIVPYKGTSFALDPATNSWESDNSNSSQRMRDIMRENSKTPNFHASAGVLVCHSGPKAALLNAEGKTWVLEKGGLSVQSKGICSRVFMENFPLLLGVGTVKNIGVDAGGHVLVTNSDHESRIIAVKRGKPRKFIAEQTADGITNISLSPRTDESNPVFECMVKNRSSIKVAENPAAWKAVTSYNDTLQIPLLPPGSWKVTCRELDVTLSPLKELNVANVEIEGNLESIAEGFLRTFVNSSGEVQSQLLSLLPPEAATYVPVLEKKLNEGASQERFSARVLIQHIQRMS